MHGGRLSRRCRRMHVFVRCFMGHFVRRRLFAACRRQSVLRLLRRRYLPWFRSRIWNLSFRLGWGNFLPLLRGRVRHLMINSRLFAARRWVYIRVRLGRLIGMLIRLAKRFHVSRPRLLRRPLFRLLLIIPLLFPAGRRGRLVMLLRLRLLLVIALPLSSRRGRCFFPLFVIGALVEALLVLAALIVAGIFRTMRFIINVPDGLGSELPAGCALDRVHARAPVFENSPLMAVYVHTVAVEVVHHASAIDDRCIVHNEVTAAVEMIPEMVHITENEERWRQHGKAGAARRPTNVVVTIAPSHPCRSPIRSRNPYPADARFVVPGAIMVTGPRPRFIALPIPTGVRPFPRANRVRLPIGCHLGGTPATAVGSHVHPGAIRTEWLIKISRRSDLDVCREIDCRERRPRQSRRGCRACQ